MKTRILIVAVATFLAGISSCSKDDNKPDEPSSAINASKTTRIKKGEPVDFTFSGVPAESNVLWTVIPFDNVQIDAAGNTATVYFSLPGSYTVNATYGSRKGNAIISVIDSTYNNGGGTPVYELLTGDQIFITVAKMDSMGITGLDFRYITEKQYNCLNHTLLFDNNFSDEGLRVVFNSVMIPSVDFCSPGVDQAYGGTAWYPVAEGIHQFEVVLDGTTYSGSFSRSGNTYTFTWPYSSGVTLTPLILN